MGALSGYKVIELAGIGPAPMGGMMLADMGAEVIRIERPGAADPKVAEPISGRNKKSVVLDLKQDAETFKKWQLLPFSQQTKIAPDQLVLPHPRMQDRAFVLAPMMDLCPDWVHPVIQKSVSQMYDVLNGQDKAEVMPL